MSIKTNKVLIGMLIVGAIIRMYLIATRSVYTDEVLYFKVAQNSSIYDLFLMNHWMKDHGVLYEILLKFLLFITSNISVLRLFNIIFYIGTGYILHSLFVHFHFGRWALLPVFIFSIHRYFIYISSMVSPYNMTIFFTVLSIYYCVRLFLIDKKSPLISYLIFVFSTTLAFYSDYSFLSVFIFYVLVFIGVYIYKKSKRLPINIAYTSVGVFILPGVIQLGNNIIFIRTLNHSVAREHTLLLSFYEFCKMTILHSKSVFPLYYFALYLTLSISVIIIFVRDKGHFKKWHIFLLLMLSYYVSVCCFLLINQFIFASFVHRSLWFFFLFDIILISFLIHFYYKKNKYVYLLIVITYCVVLIFNICKTRVIDDYTAPGDVAYTIAYGDFIAQYQKDRRAAKDTYIFLIDEGYALVPLQEYYLPNLFASSAYSAQDHVIKKVPYVIQLNQKNAKLPHPLFYQCGVSYTLVYLEKSKEGKKFVNQDKLEKNARAIYRLWQKESGEYILLREK